MIEMRWLEVEKIVMEYPVNIENGIPVSDYSAEQYEMSYTTTKLQYRVLLSVDMEWTDWAYVPTVKEREA